MRRKPFGARLVESMREGLSALKSGAAPPRIERPELPGPPAFTKRGIAELRTSYGLTQREFSKLMMISPKTLQSWEQGTRKPGGAALRFLQVLQSPETLNQVFRLRNADEKARTGKTVPK